MVVTADNLLYHELAGLRVTIADSPDITIRGVSGSIVSETKNTIYIESDQNRILQVAKKAAKTIQLITPSGVCFISGTSLIGKPEDRIARLNY